MTWKTFKRTRPFGKRLFGPTLVKARSGLVPVFQRPEQKLSASLPLYRRARQLILAQPVKHSVRTVIIVTPVSMTTIKIASIKTWVREHWEIQRSQSRWWRFVDVDYFISTYNHLISNVGVDWSNSVSDKRDMAMLPA